PGQPRVRPDAGPDPGAGGAVRAEPGVPQPGAGRGEGPLLRRPDDAPRRPDGGGQGPAGDVAAAGPQAERSPPAAGRGRDEAGPGRRPGQLRGEGPALTG